MEVFGKQDLGFEETILDLRALYDSMVNESEPLSSKIYRKRNTIQSLAWEKLHRMESILRKISKCKWLIEEDQTYNFFHLFMKDRLRNNNITALRHVDTLIEDADDIKAFMFDHFKSRIQGSNHRMRRMDGVCSNKLSMEYRTKLEAPFSLLDLKQAIWNSTKYKSPDTNGFTMRCYKAS